MGCGTNQPTCLLASRRHDRLINIRHTHSATFLPCTSHTSYPPLCPLVAQNHGTFQNTFGTSVHWVLLQSLHGLYSQITSKFRPIRHFSYRRDGRPTCALTHPPLRAQRATHGHSRSLPNHISTPLAMSFLAPPSREVPSGVSRSQVTITQFRDEIRISSTFPRVSFYRTYTGTIEFWRFKFEPRHAYPMARASTYWNATPMQVNYIQLPKFAIVVTC